MNKHIKNIIAYSDGHLIGNNRKRFEKELQNNEELRYDYYLLKKINESMKGRLDLEEVKNDPSLSKLVPVVENFVTDYLQNPEKYKGNQKFVRDSLSKGETGSDLIEDINDIKKEIKDYNVNELAEKWVNEWNERKENLEANITNKESNRDFIIRSLESDDARSDLRMSNKKNFNMRKLMISIIGLSAAALIAVLFVIKALIPSSDPERLYKSYYEPMRVFSPVTRNITNLSGKYAKAIEMYKQGNYKTAAAGFFDLMQQDSSLTAPRFFVGITKMALGNYSQAIVFLSWVSERSEEYRKEAQWYLGLSYLKTGESSKAIACFEVLAASEGIYQDKSRNLIRRLK